MYVKDRTEAPRPHQKVGRRREDNLANDQFHLNKWDRSLYRHSVCGASKIKVKKVNKKRTVTVRRLIIFLNISRRPLLICLQCYLHQYKILKAVATATAAIVLLTPTKNLKKVFLGFLVVSPLLNHFLG